MRRILNTVISNSLLSLSIVTVQVLAQDVEWELSDTFVGIGSVEPESKLHVFGQGDSSILVENSDAGPAAPRKMFEIKNNGNLSFFMTNTHANSSWKFVAGTQANSPGGADSFRISKLGIGPVLQVFDTGNATLQGALTQNSDVNAKQDIEPTDQHSILSKVMELQISEWSYKDDPTTRHIGPMAQDFYRLFSLGHTEKGLTSIDTAGVALAALQGLHKQFEKVNNENQILKSKLHYQHERIAQLEVALSELLSRNTLRR